MFLNKNKLILITLGVLFIFLSFYFARKSFSFTKDSVHTTGVLIGYIADTESCSLVVNFKTKHDESIRFINKSIELYNPESPFGTANGPVISWNSNEGGCFIERYILHKNPVVKILYHQTKPQMAVIDSFFYRHLLTYFFAFIGLLLILIGFIKKY